MLSLNLQECVLSEQLYAGDLFLIIETTEKLRNKFRKWKEAFERKVLKMNLGKTKVIVSEGTKKDSLSESSFALWGQWLESRLIMICVQCGRFFHKMKGAVHKSCVRPVVLYGSEAWCLKESNMGIS